MNQEIESEIKAVDLDEQDESKFNDSMISRNTLSKFGNSTSNIDKKLTKDLPNIKSNIPMSSNLMMIHRLKMLKKKTVGQNEETNDIELANENAEF